MTIEFEKDYGYAPAAPFWLVASDELGLVGSRYLTPEAAEEFAASQAAIRMSETFHVLAVVTTVKAEAKVKGERFDPNRRPPIPKADVSPALPDEPLADTLVECAPPISLDDGEPF